MRTEAETRQVLGGVISRDLLPLLVVNSSRPELHGRGCAAGHRGHRLRPVAVDVRRQSVLGRTIELTGTAYTVIGVAPAWFRYPRSEFQLWTTLGTMEAKAPAQARNRALRIFTVVGRLRTDVTLAQARSDSRASASNSPGRIRPRTRTWSLPWSRCTRIYVGDIRPALLVLLTTVGLLLLIACANVANLMLARATGREREIAIRSALGAGRKRLLQQLAIESFVLAAAGGVAGGLLALWGVEALPALLEARVPRAEGIGLRRARARVCARRDGTHRALLRARARPAQRRGPCAGVEGGRPPRRGHVARPRDPPDNRRRRNRAGGRGDELVLVGAGLLVRSFMTLTSRNPGFDPENVTSFMVQFLKLPDGPARARAAEALINRLAQLPGVQAAGGSTGLPTVTPQRNTRFEIEGRSLDGDDAFAFFIAASPGKLHRARRADPARPPVRSSATRGPASRWPSSTRRSRTGCSPARIPSASGSA